MGDWMLCRHCRPEGEVVRLCSYHGSTTALIEALLKIAETPSASYGAVEARNTAKAAIRDINSPEGG